jgi:hypothetical protein
MGKTARDRRDRRRPARRRDRHRAALFGLDCTVYMGEVDVERQALNVFRMKLLGAEVVPVESGSATLKDAVNEAMRDWVASRSSTHYCIGSAMGPHPFPWMVREFQRVVGDEAREQCRAILDGDDPDVVVACVGGGSNAIGTFAGFVDTTRAWSGSRRGARARVGHHGAAVSRACPASCTACDRCSCRTRTASPRSALDQRRARLPRCRPEHAMLAATGRAEYDSATDDEASPGSSSSRRPRASCPRSSPRTRQPRTPRTGQPWSATCPIGYPDVATSDGSDRGAHPGHRRRPAATSSRSGCPTRTRSWTALAIQRAGTAALERGVRTRDVFGAVSAVARRPGTPALVMTYWNLVDHYGVRAFARDFAAAGGAGLITPDLTPGRGRRVDRRERRVRARPGLPGGPLQH